MIRIAGIASLLGVVLLGTGLVLSMTGTFSGSVPGSMTVTGVILLFLWPLARIMQPGAIWRRFAGNATTFVGIVLVAVVLILINIIGSRYSLRWDATRSGRFSLSPQTVQLLASLDAPVEALAFFPEGEGIEAKDLLVEYDAAGHDFSYRLVDPDRHPEEAIRYKVRDYGTVVFILGDRWERVTTHTEDHYTSALSRLISNKVKRLFFAVGHDERSIEDTEKEGLSTMAEILRDDGYVVEEVLLLRDGLPDPGDVLIYAGPVTGLLPTELDSISLFILSGGRVFFGLEPNPAPDFDELLSQYGVTPRNDIVLDASGIGSLFGMSEVVPLVATYSEEHKITEAFNAATFFPMCRSLAISDSIPEDVSAICLATTSEASWGETGSLDVEEIAFDEGADTGGPVCVLAAVESGMEPESGLNDTIGNNREWRMVVSGDIGFASNGYLGISANRDLFMNCISWLAQREELIGIRPKDEDAQPLMLPAQAATSIFYLVVLVIPGIVLAAGISVWFRRR